MREGTVNQINYRDQARTYVNKHFPSLENIEPMHTTRLHGRTQLHVYTFEREYAIPGGVLSQMVRVFVSAEGKIVKAISSR
jgi:hypothetical protein